MSSSQQPQQALLQLNTVPLQTGSWVPSLKQSFGGVFLSAWFALCNGRLQVWEVFHSGLFPPVWWVFWNRFFLEGWKNPISVFRSFSWITTVMLADFTVCFLNFSCSCYCVVWRWKEKGCLGGMIFKQFSVFTLQLNVKLKHFSWKLSFSEVNILHWDLSFNYRKLIVLNGLNT